MSALTPLEEQGIVGGQLGDMKEAAQAPLGRISSMAPLSLLCVGRKTGGKIQREKVEY